MKTCYVKYLPNLKTGEISTKKYIYSTTIEDLQHGDMVVVPVLDSFTLATFIAYEDEVAAKKKELNGIKIKTIVQKVDFTEYNKALEKKEKKRKLKAKLDEEKAKAEELYVYAMLAQSNPELQALLDEYKSLL